MKNINLLSQNEDLLVNYRNVLRLFVTELGDSGRWGIRVEYSGGGQNVLARFNSQRECETAFTNAARSIASGVKLISFRDL